MSGSEDFSGVGLAGRLKEAMCAGNWSTKALAARICQVAPGVRVSGSTIWSYQTGQTLPKSDVLRALSDALGVSAEWLLGYERPMRPLSEATWRRILHLGEQEVYARLRIPPPDELPRVVPPRD